MTSLLLSEGPFADARRHRRWASPVMWSSDSVDQFEQHLTKPDAGQTEAALAAFDQLLASADVE